jgi:hypothetical protein
MEVRNLGVGSPKRCPRPKPLRPSGCVPSAQRFALNSGVSHRVASDRVLTFFCHWPQLEGRLPVRFWLSIRCIEPMRFRILLQGIHILADAGMIGQLSDFVRASALEFPEAGIRILSLQSSKRDAK